MKSVFSGYGYGMHLPETGKLCLIRYHINYTMFFEDAVLVKDDVNVWTKQDGAPIPGEVIQWEYKENLLI